MTDLEWFGLGCGVFLAAAAYDVAVARYTQSVAAGRRGHASVWSALIASLGVLLGLGVMKASPWLALPEIVGFAVGTYAGVKPC